jgi:hypothetical protein
MSGFVASLIEGTFGAISMVTLFLAGITAGGLQVTSKKNNRESAQGWV